MNQVTQQNAASSEESASAAEELSSQAEELRAMVAEFQTTGKRDRKAWGDAVSGDSSGTIFSRDRRKAA